MRHRTRGTQRVALVRLSAFVALATAALMVALPQTASAEPFQTTKTAVGKGKKSRPPAPTPTPTPTPTPVTGPASCPVPTSPVIQDAPGAGKTVALTFDDGPGPSTPAILDILKNNGVHASFFVNGWTTAQYPAYAKRAVTEGHVVGNHTWSHFDMATLPFERQYTELNDAAALIEKTTGQWPCWSRPPFGSYNNDTLSAASQLRSTLVMWNTYTTDWAAGTSYDEAVKAEVIQAIQESAGNEHPMVLLHDGDTQRPTTVAALPEIINWYKANGYTFVRVDGKS